jgi:hypothetical protein
MKRLISSIPPEPLAGICSPQNPSITAKGNPLLQAKEKNPNPCQNQGKQKQKTTKSGEKRDPKPNPPKIKSPIPRFGISAGFYPQASLKGIAQDLFLKRKRSLSIKKGRKKTAERSPRP